MLPLLPSLPRFLCIPVHERPICLMLLPGGPIPASLHPPWLQKIWVVSLVVAQLADVSRCYETWADITTDSFVLDIVKHGITLDFCSQAFCSNYTPRCSLTAAGAKVVDAEIKLLLLKHVISPAELKADSFVSSIFTTMKPDSSHRTILNLKNLNERITYVHFKMKSLKHVRHLIKPGVWMGYIDLRDAYYSVRVNPPFQRYFTCYWTGC